MFGNLPRFIHYGITKKILHKPFRILSSQLLVNFLGDNIGPIYYLRSIGPKQWIQPQNRVTSYIGDRTALWSSSEVEQPHQNSITGRAASDYEIIKRKPIKTWPSDSLIQLLKARPERCEHSIGLFDCEPRSGEPPPGAVIYATRTPRHGPPDTCPIGPSKIEQ